MKGFSVAAFIFQIFISTVFLFFAFFYFDPINALDQEAETINFLVFGIVVQLKFLSLTILACILVGLPLRIIPRMQFWWLSRFFLQLLVLGTGIAILVLSKLDGLRVVETVIQNGEMVVKDYSDLKVSLSGWFLTAFALLHFNPSNIAEYFSNKLVGGSDWSREPLKEDNR